jgi:predicted RNA-binding protein with PUA-like domain
MRYWLVKTEPSTFSIDDFAKEGLTQWDGVRNYQARNHLMSMTPGDLVLIYHSVSNPAVVGLAEVSSHYYPDVTDETGKFCAVTMGFLKKFSRHCTLAAIKQNPALEGLILLKQSRLSVMPVEPAHFNAIIALTA